MTTGQQRIRDTQKLRVWPVRPNGPAAPQTLTRAISRFVRQSFNSVATYLQRQSVYEELATLSDRELRDIGISPADFNAIANGTIADDISRRPRYWRAPEEARLVLEARNYAQQAERKPWMRVTANHS
ncbi:MAG: DUF1127 domain-containing protein [Gammaproteobacteria bacterium]|nr:DUF1127 domain-containing protein [Gammaproteobacteria bacterium]